ncbi:CoA-binding protein [Hyphomicrobium sp.]|uniref:CoA-binding protein n=1 Tax=Hyphomicrobium sp. TaxID=82 RepID=UPI002B7363FE|nr:CoA-binding protein [Hyphomicrobium sp.]HRN88461.1 CoA-binding protein [Hyphomicrobium sp.]HRQ25578.1 CoA-binding protein [Hyphomicrobium sp.]
MTHVNPSDDEIRNILQATRTIALVGASDKPSRPSNGVMRSLQAEGYRVIPVNPSLAGQTLLGERVAADLASIEEPVDIVDIFRNSEAALEVVRAAIGEKERLGIGAVWLQIGVINETAAREAAEAGLAVVMDLCLKVEQRRLMG